MALDGQWQTSGLWKAIYSTYNSDIRTANIHHNQNFVVVKALYMSNSCNNTVNYGNSYNIEQVGMGGGSKEAITCPATLGELMTQTRLLSPLSSLSATIQGLYVVFILVIFLE